MANTDEVLHALHAIGADSHELDALHSRVASAVLPMFRAASPRLSGAMAASFRGTVRKSRAVVASDLVYAPVVTFGWPAHNIAPNRWDKPVVTAAGPRVLELYRAEFNRIIARHGAGR